MEENKTPQVTYTQGTYSTSNNNGKSNDSVVAIQQKVNDWINTNPNSGIEPLVEDGLYGGKTQAAVTAYQKAKGVKGDSAGVVGNETAASLGLLTAAGNTTAADTAAGGTATNTADTTEYDTNKIPAWIGNPHSSKYTSSSSGTSSYDNATTYAPQSMEDYTDWLEAYGEEYLAAVNAANQANTDASVAEIETNLENSLSEYSQLAAEAYLTQKREQSNAALNSAIAGDMGGTAQAQYDAATAQYDASLLQIALEREALINSSKNQIAQLEAQGRLADATALSDWLQSKLTLLDNQESELVSYYQNQQTLALQQDQLALQKDQLDYTKYSDEYKNAIALIEKGASLSEYDLRYLGIDQDWAKYYSELMQTNNETEKAYAQAQLKAALQTLGSGSDGTVKSNYKGNMTDGEYTIYQQYLNSTGVPVLDASGNQVGTFAFAANGNPTFDMTSGDYHINLAGRDLYWDDVSGDWVDSKTYNSPENKSVRDTTTWLNKVESTYNFGSNDVETSKILLTDYVDTAEQEMLNIENEMNQLDKKYSITSYYTGYAMPQQYGKEFKQAETQYALLETKRAQLEQNIAQAQVILNEAPK